MNTDTLIQVAKTRLKMHTHDDNTTGKSFFYELVMALERLKEYEASDKTKDSKDVSLDD